MVKPKPIQRKKPDTAVITVGGHKDAFAALCFCLLISVAFLIFLLVLGMEG